MIEVPLERAKHVKPEYDANNPHYRHEMGEYLSREAAIAIEGTNALRDRLKYCYRVEGINHKKYCAELIDAYSHRFQLFSGNYRNWDQQKH